MTERAGAGDGHLLGRLFCRQVTRSPDRDLSLERMSDDRAGARAADGNDGMQKEGVVAECQAELSRNARAIIAPLDADKGKQRAQPERESSARKTRAEEGEYIL